MALGRVVFWTRTAAINSQLMGAVPDSAAIPGAQKTRTASLKRAFHKVTLGLRRAGTVMNDRRATVRFHGSTPSTGEIVIRLSVALAAVGVIRGPSLTRLDPRQ